VVIKKEGSIVREMKYCTELKRRVIFCQQYKEKCLNELVTSCVGTAFSNTLLLVR